MENVNENLVKNEFDDSKKNVNIKKFKNYIYKHSSLIAVILSIISILFSTFALFNANKHPKRDFRMERPYGVQENMPNNYFNGGNFNNENDNRFFGQKRNIKENYKKDFNPNNQGRRQKDSNDKKPNINQNNNNRPNNKSKNSPKQ